MPVAAGHRAVLELSECSTGLRFSSPALAVSVWCLQDTDRSGLWILIALVPLIGFIVLLVFMVQGSDHGHNQYGSNPKKAAI